jgi:hypothetical protein
VSDFGGRDHRRAVDELALEAFSEWSALFDRYRPVDPVIATHAQRANDLAHEVLRLRREIKKLSVKGSL